MKYTVVGQHTIDELRTLHRLVQGDARDLSFIPDESIHLVLTSPPYWGLRDYSSARALANLCVRWVPDGGSKLSGEVREGVVYIYEESGAKVLQTLRHEFLDYLVNEAVWPYKEVSGGQERLMAF